ncbi:hypothetical protein B0G81_1718 [Paraburkholderia sp. BL6665CI2N2]|nr:hypothetical protein B0G81_1718 [Paraburkholderia sp. BL6665CI2N2]
MKRRVGGVGVAGGDGRPRFLAVAWRRAWDVSNEQVFKAHCSYHAWNCTFIVPFLAGHFQMFP